MGGNRGEARAAGSTVPLPDAGPHDLGGASVGGLRPGRLLVLGGANGVPVVGGLPVVGNGSLPVVGNLPVVGDLLPTVTGIVGNVTNGVLGGATGSGGLPVVGSVLPTVTGLVGNVTGG